MTTVITYGTYDLLHIGHVNLLQRAAALGDRLVVAVSTDEFNAVKGKRCVYPFADRKEIVEALRCVDAVIAEHRWEQKRSDIHEHGADIFVMGDDWVGKFDDLRDICRVQYLPRTPTISTTYFRETIAGGVAQKSVRLSEVGSAVAR